VAVGDSFIVSILVPFQLFVPKPRPSPHNSYCFAKGAHLAETSCNRISRNKLERH